jgi:uncharacterized phiE125 gp8 family phage protein
MTLKVVTPPTVEPVTLEEAKSHLRVDFTDDDAYIQGLISAARGYAEGVQKRSLAPQTLELTIDSFPSKISLQRGPVRSVGSVKYTTRDGNSNTIASTDYMLSAAGDVIPLVNWPSDLLLPADGVQVQYAAGYTEIPATTKQAILLMIGHWYENREAVVIGQAPSELPLAVNSLLWLDRTW